MWALFFTTSQMSAIKNYLYELREMWQTCNEQDQHIEEALMNTDPEDWMEVTETTYTVETNANT